MKKFAAINITTFACACTYEAELSGFPVSPVLPPQVKLTDNFWNPRIDPTAILPSGIVLKNVRNPVELRTSK